MDKHSLFAELTQRLRAELANIERLARETAAAANHPEARPENDKDTRKIELSYLAAGQAARAGELESGLALLASVPIRDFHGADPLASGALITLEIDGKRQRVLLCPAGGGVKLGALGQEVGVVTPEAPLGRELLGRNVGDAFELRVAGAVREVEIIAVE